MPTPRTGQRWQRRAASLPLWALTAAMLALPPAALAVRRGSEAVSCGGAASESASYRAHDTVAQGPIGDMAEGAGLRLRDGFWLTLPSINVPVEGAVTAALTGAGTSMIRWTVASVAEIAGFNVCRATNVSGPFEILNAEPLPPESPGRFEDTTVWPQTTFWYEVRAVLADGTEDIVSGSPASVTTGGLLALRFYPARPNPTAGSTLISFDVPDHSGRVSVVIHNVRGQRVRTLVHGPTERGRHERAWDGTDDAGHTVASGIYFARLEVDGRTDIQKILMLR